MSVKTFKLLIKCGLTNDWHFYWLSNWIKKKKVDDDDYDDDDEISFDEDERRGNDKRA